jgi:fido (protein-threonine AMPylation protein)/predicted transcriptional regulator
MMDFEQYIRQGESEQKEKSLIWQTAIGLQQVDGLIPSQYLVENAKENIEGKITIEEVKYRIDNYYKQQSDRKGIEDNRTEEADKVSARITEILLEKTFSFSPVELVTIHRRLFTGIYDFAGILRNYNITKAEWVLNGKTVFYASAESIKDTLDYDFAQENAFNYKGLNKKQVVEHIANFISGIWQIHAFGEGNTRTVAIFTIKYLRTFGFEVKKELFINNSWYFRNALVRANYNDYENNVHATPKYLNNFFGNLLLEETNELKNRYLRVVLEKDTSIRKSHNPVDVLLNDTEKVILELIKNNNKITYEQIAGIIGKSRKTIQRMVAELRKKSIISRMGTDKNGTWVIVKPSDDPVNDPIKLSGDPVNDPVKSSDDPVNDSVKSSSDLVNDSVKLSGDPVNNPVKSSSDPVNDTEKVILELIKNNNKITYEQIAGIIGKSRKTTQRAIAELRKKGIISRMGADKNGTWVVNNQTF